MKYTPSASVQRIHDLYNRWMMVSLVSIIGIPVSGVLMVELPAVGVPGMVATFGTYFGAMGYASILHKRYLKARDVEFHEWLDGITQMRGDRMDR